MQEDLIIQTNLFAVNNKTNDQIENNNILEDLSAEELKNHKKTKRKKAQKPN